MTEEITQEYSGKVAAALQLMPTDPIRELFQAILTAWKNDAQLFICGNGGSAANALHIANDLFYGIAKGGGKAMRAQALCANQSIMTCLANDVSYDDIFSEQLAVLGRKGDVLLALSGSGNSGNILKALDRAREMGIRSSAILGYSGGKAAGAADIPIHIPIDDMQVSEDLQLIIGHMLMQWLARNNPHLCTKG